mgnify:CR=1 FL=1
MDKEMDKYDKYFAPTSEPSDLEKISRLAPSLLGEETPEAKSIRHRDNLAKSYSPKTFFSRLDTLYRFVLFLILVLLIAMAGFSKTAAWLGWTECWWWIGATILHRAQKRGFEAKEQAQVSAVTTVTGVPSPTRYISE